MSFLFKKVEDVTTISKSQSLTSVSIKDCTLRVPNKTTTLILYEQYEKQSSLHYGMYALDSREHILCQQTRPLVEWVWVLWRTQETFIILLPKPIG